MAVMVAFGTDACMGSWAEGCEAPAGGREYQAPRSVPCAVRCACMLQHAACPEYECCVWCMCCVCVVAWYPVVCPMPVSPCCVWCFVVRTLSGECCPVSRVFRVEPGPGRRGCKPLAADALLRSPWSAPCPVPCGQALMHTPCPSVLGHFLSLQPHTPLVASGMSFPGG